MILLGLSDAAERRGKRREPIESRSSACEVDANVNASHVTKDRRVSFDGGQQYRDSRFTLSDGPECRFLLQRADASAQHGARVLGRIRYLIANHD